MLIDTCTMRSLEIFQERDLLGVNVQKEAKKPPKNLWLSLGNEQLGDESIFAVEKKTLAPLWGSVFRIAQICSACRSSTWVDTGPQMEHTGKV